MASGSGTSAPSARSLNAQPALRSLTLLSATTAPGRNILAKTTFAKEPQTGAIRVTDEPATLPADAAQSELCPTICLVCSDAEETDDENPVAGQKKEGTQHGSVASVLAAKAVSLRGGIYAAEARSSRAGHIGLVMAAIQQAMVSSAFVCSASMDVIIEIEIYSPRWCVTVLCTPLAHMGTKPITG